MKKLACWLLCLVFCIASGAAEIVCKHESFRGHLQGIAADPSGIYWSFTDVIVKTDYAGNPLKQVKTPWHAGDLCIMNGKLYVSLCYYRKEMIQKEGGSGWIYVYSPELNFLEKKALPDTPNPDGITFAQGKFFISNDDFGKNWHPYNFICVYTPDFKLEKKIKVDVGVKTAFGAQTLNAFEGQILAGFYAKQTSWLLSLPDLKTMGVFPAVVHVGMAYVPAELSNGKKLLLIAVSTGDPKKRNFGGKVRIMEWKEGKLFPADLKK